MAHVVADRVKVTSTTTGTGTYTLGSTATGFQAFSVIGDGNTTWYCATDGTDWEVGLGTYTAAGTTLARTTILASSNAGAAVNWAAGTRTIFGDMPAAAYADEWVRVANNVSIGTSTTKVQSLGAKYRELIIVWDSVSHDNGSSRTLTLNVSDDGTNYDTAVDISASLTAAQSSTNTLRLLNTGLTATKYFDFATGTASFRGAFAVKTGYTQSIRFALSGAGNFDGGTYSVYGLK